MLQRTTLDPSRGLDGRSALLGWYERQSADLQFGPRARPGNLNAL
jgi:hypothetical protein